MTQDFDLTMPTERAEKYLAKMAKQYDGTLPEPISNIDKYLKILAENDAGGGSGGENTPKPLENADLNTVTETGFYYADFDHTCKNVPSKVGTYGFSIVVINGGGVVYQLLMKNTMSEENRLFMRAIDSDGEVYPWSNYMQESDVIVDSVLSETSTRPPQNAIVTKRLNEIESSAVLSDTGWNRLTKSSAMTGWFTVYIRKIGKFVEINGDFAVPTYKIGKTIITTLSEEFRPSRDIYFPIGYNAVSTMKNIIATIHIDPANGNVEMITQKYDNNNDQTSFNMGIHVTYTVG